MSATDIKEAVKERYGKAALRVTGSESGCCGGSASSAGCGDPITSNLYDVTQIKQIPEEALLASLGCGNPTALASSILARPCSTWDRAAESTYCFRRGAWATGKAYGLDMTDEMLALGEREQAQIRYGERRVPQRRDREHSSARQFCRRHHLELRHQPLRRQGQGFCARRFAC